MPFRKVCLPSRLSPSTECMGRVGRERKEEKTEKEEAVAEATGQLASAGEPIRAG